MSGGPSDFGGNVFPFGASFDVGTRYQQAYDASNFSAGAISITAISFLGGTGTLSTNNATFSLSTITAGIDTLSTTDFAGNLGADNALFAIVALSGTAPLTLTITGGPFLYDPANGNLLLDIQLDPGGGMGDAAYEARNGGSATGIFSRYHNFGSGTIGWGLVTQFDYTQAAEVGVPEPATYSLMLISLIAMALIRRGAGSPRRRARE